MFVCPASAHLIFRTTLTSKRCVEGENPKPTTACREAANASQTHTQVCACRKGAVRCVTQQDDAFFLFDLIFLPLRETKNNPP